MLSSSQRNLCWRIAMGEEKEEDLARPLTKEEKDEIKDYKEEIAYYKANGLDDLLDAMSFDE